MEVLSYKNSRLYVESCAVEMLAKKHGTPLYVYSSRHLREQFRSLAAAMRSVRPLICYSVKANTNAAVIQTLAAEGAGADVVSGGELYRALRAGVPAQKIVFAGVGKTAEEIEYALRQRILFFTVESMPEAVRISTCAQKLGRKARIAFRINPDVDPDTHAHITTGKKENKFGIHLTGARQAYRRAARLPGIEIAGIHLHIGSQILSARPFAEALRRIHSLCVDLKKEYSDFTYLDMGGGLGIDYRPGQAPLFPATYARQVLPGLRQLGLSVVLEPGRFLVGNAGILVCRVQYVKRNPHKTFVIVDVAMNDLIRPLLYDAHHEVVAVRKSRGTVRADLVGPICESGDFLALGRDLPAVREGELLALRSAGAYAFSMASNYNSRPRPAEVMVDGKRSFLVRKREQWSDLVRGEIPPTTAGSRLSKQGRDLQKVTKEMKQG